MHIEVTDQITSVDLGSIGKTLEERKAALDWLVSRHGVSGQGVWRLTELQYVEFSNPKHATMFILKFS